MVMSGVGGYQVLSHEAQGLLGRIGRLRPFSLRIPSVAAAAIAPRALRSIEHYLAVAARELAAKVRAFLSWLRGNAALGVSIEQAQRRLTVLRLRFNVILNELDLFADALGQRAEHEVGTWLAGLDAVAADALVVPGTAVQPPPVIC